MAQAQMRMPRHGFRPDGSKPYGPHGPMAPPPHMKVNLLFFLKHKLLLLSQSFDVLRKKKISIYYFI